MINILPPHTCSKCNTNHSPNAQNCFFHNPVQASFYCIFYKKYTNNFNNVLGNHTKRGMNNVSNIIPCHFFYGNPVFVGQKLNACVTCAASIAHVNGPLMCIN